MDDRQAATDDEIIGDDRDSSIILESLRRGVSIVLVGPLGSGKSHVIRHLIDLLTVTDQTPLVLRSGGPLTLAPHDALAASADARASRLREGRPLGDERPIVMIDDAHELDSASIAAVVRAVYAGHATALFGLTMTRDGSTEKDDSDQGSAQMAIDLWLRGLAERVDLAPLTPRDAEHLLDEFDIPGVDSLTRASIIALCDGSRMLLKQLATEAARALRQGRDPIEAIRDSAPHGRLSDALAAHVSHLAPSERTTLAVLGYLQRIERVDAARFLPSSTLDALVAARLVHDDSTPAHRLTANAALAQEADRRLGPLVVERLLDSALTRMLASGSDWWCTPLALLAAQSWLHGGALGTRLERAASRVRARAALDAARHANDNGEPALAAAYARLGLQSVQTAGLLLEEEFADTLLGASVDLEALAERLSSAPVEPSTPLRCTRLASYLTGHDVDAVLSVSARIAALTVPDPRAEGERALLRAEAHAAQMEWGTAAEEAERIFADRSNSSSLRMRAAVVAGLARTCLGRVCEGETWFLRAHRCAGERGGISPVTTADRIWADSVQIFAATLSGNDLGSAIARLSGDIDAAARQGDQETQALAGLAIACALAASGEADQAARELEVAVRRARPPLAAIWVPWAQISVGRALVLAGRVNEARALLHLVDPGVVSGLPTLAHARTVVDSYIAAASGSRDAALANARTAATMSISTPALLARDLYQLIVLGDVDTAMPRLRRLAAASDAPSMRALSDLAAALVASGDDDRDVLEAMRRGATREGCDTPGAGIRFVPDLRHRQLPAQDSHATPLELDLTRREHEIALLVAEGMSNREIAERLYLSVRTVESHVYQARAKVGARSRAELGRTVVPHSRRPYRDRMLIS